MRPDEQQFLAANLTHWDEVVPIHAASAFYDVAGFRVRPDSLKPIEVAEAGEVRGKTLLHLQYHFGMDSISWARRGAQVTGVDFSPVAIDQARTLAREVGTAVRFVCSSVDDLPRHLEGLFDIVFTSYGVLSWLPDKQRWARTAAHFLKPGGTFYIVAFHPFAAIFDSGPDGEAMRIAYRYFPDGEPQVFEGLGTYTDREAPLKHNRTYEFPFTVGEVLTSLVEAGLRIEFLHEFPHSTYQFLPFTHQTGPDEVRLLQHAGSVPLLFSIKATKPV